MTPERNSSQGSRVLFTPGCICDLRQHEWLTSQLKFSRGVYLHHDYNKTMKRAEKTLGWLLCGLVVSTGAKAATANPAGNPYQGIVERNLFSLKPAPRPEDAPKPPAPPPPKIDLTGIMTILGKKQVLMKIHLPAKPPEPAKDESYILSEGERDGDVEVLAIDQSTGSVKLNNHGVEQDLSLDKDSAKITGAPPPAPGGAPPLPMFQPPTPPGAPPAPDGTMRSIPLPNRQLRQPGGPNAYNNQNNQDAPSLPSGIGGGYGGTSGTAPAAAQPQNNLSFEEQEVLLAAQHMNAVQRGDPVGPIIPLTPRVMRQLYPNGQSQQPPMPPTP